MQGMRLALTNTLKELLQVTMSSYQLLVWMFLAAFVTVSMPETQTVRPDARQTPRPQQCAG